MNLIAGKNIPPSLNDFSLALLKEVRACFHSANQQNTAKSSLFYLVSVGGLQVQDLPMSGNLQASQILQRNIYLHALLSCFTAPLGRVYLVHQSQSTDHTASIYQNVAHPLFYQTLYLDIEAFAHQCSINPQTLTKQWLEQQPNSLYYLAVEVVKLKHDSIFSHEQQANHSDLFNEDKFRQLLPLDIDQSPLLNIAEAQLNLLSIVQIKQGLSIIMDNYHDYCNESERQTLELSKQNFITQWDGLLYQFGYDYQGEAAYQSALNQFRINIMNPVNRFLVKMTDEKQRISKQLLDTIAFQLNLFPPAPQRINRASLNKSLRRKPRDSKQLNVLPHFDRPVFIVSAPRSGSTLLFETLVQFNQLWSTGEENHAQLEAINGLHPRDNQWHSNCLYAEHANTTVKDEVARMFIAQLQNKQQQHFLDLADHERPESLRFVEKTPKNALRIPFIKALYPDALFIYLHREAKSNISSLIDGWRSQRFIGYRGELPKYSHRHWSFLLIPEWQQWLDRSIAEIATQQWHVSNHTIQAELDKLSSSDWMSLDYQTLIDSPKHSIETISQFAGLEWDVDIAARCQDRLPVSRLTLSAPQQDKWLKHKNFLNPLLNVQESISR